MFCFVFLTEIYLFFFSVFILLKTVKQNGGPKSNGNVNIPDVVSEQLRETVFHLQKDLDRITSRVRSLEVAILSSQPQVSDVTFKGSRIDDVFSTTIEIFDNRKSIR